MNAKPILVIRIPIEATFYKEELNKQLRELQEKMSDYHIIPTLESGVTITKFECYNSPTDELTIEKLSEIEQKINEYIFIINETEK